MGAYTRAMGLFFVLVFLTTPFVCVPLMVFQSLVRYVRVQVFYLRYSALLNIYIENLSKELSAGVGGGMKNLSAVMLELNRTATRLLRLASENGNNVTSPTPVDRFIAYVVSFYVIYPWAVVLVVVLDFIVSVVVGVRPSSSYEELLGRSL